MKRQFLVFGLLFTLGLTGCPERSQSRSTVFYDAAGQNVNSSTHDAEASPPETDLDIKSNTTSQDSNSEGSASSTPSPSEKSSVPPIESALAEFLQEVGTNLQEISYSVEYIDLNSDNRADALVMLNDLYWCGTGGCNLVIFKGVPQGYQPISNISLVREPVWISTTKTNGWHDLILEVSGGGTPAKHVALKFDGHQYPDNPSIEPAIAPSASEQLAELFITEP